MWESYCPLCIAFHQPVMSDGQLQRECFIEPLLNFSCLFFFLQDRIVCLIFLVMDIIGSVIICILLLTFSIARF